MLGLLWAASSLSTSFSTASIGDEVGFKPYNEDMIQNNLLHCRGLSMKSSVYMCFLLFSKSKYSLPW